MSHPYPLAAEQLLHQNYRIVCILGSGGFGVTYLTEHIRLGNRFVIKEYFPSELAQRLPDSSEVLPHAAHRELFERGMRYFFREAQLLHRLKHPNIVPVTDLFEANGTAYFVMPYIGGDTLSDYLHRHPQPDCAELNTIFLPLLDALAYLHNQRILHRDIKPQNILLADNTPILIDFGAARRFAAGPNTQSSLLFISQGYSPIEQYGGGKLSPASDLYALSACLYQAVTGKLPPPATDRIGRRLPALADNPDYRARYPQAWLAAVDKGFSLAPPQRFQTVVQMRQALNNAANNGNETTVPPPALHRQPEKAAAVKPTAKAEEQNKADKGVMLAVTVLVMTLCVILLAIYSGKREEQNSYIAESPVLSESASDIEGMDNASAVYASDAGAIAAQDAAAEETEEAASDFETTEQSMASDVSREELKSLRYAAEKNDMQALEKLKAIAEQGNRDAQYELGWAYRVLQDYRQAVHWFHQAAEQGHEIAKRRELGTQVLLAVSYETGDIPGIEKDAEQAVYWYRKAAEQGYEMAQNNLGVMYAKGYGVEKDDEQAVAWYRKAAEQGHARAQNNLGFMYLNGYGVEKDYKQALKWYRKAAEQGHASAQYNLAWMYEYGKGVAQDREQAVRLYRQAAQQNDDKETKEKAQRALKRLQAE